MLTKTFLFKNIAVNGARVSNGVAVGLPSLTGLTGLSSAFAAQLSLNLGHKASDLQAVGVALAFEDYHLHEGYKRAVTAENKKGAPGLRAVVGAYASFKAHLVFEVQATDEAAQETLISNDVVDVATQTLQGLRLCGASLLDAKRPVNLQTPRLSRCSSAKEAALSAIPGRARVIVAEPYLVESMREKGLPLMEAFQAALLPASVRPQKYKSFFAEEDELNGSSHAHVYAVVQDGFRKLADLGKDSNRLTYDAKALPVEVVSATMTLVRLQTAASLLCAVPEDDGRPAHLRAFWRMVDGGASGAVCKPGNELQDFY